MIHVIKEIQVETTHPGRRQWQPTPVFLPGEFHGHRSLVGYSPWGHRVRYDFACVYWTVTSSNFKGKLEKEMATHSSVLAWRIPRTGEPGGLPSMGSHWVGHDWSDLVAVVVVGEKSRVQTTGLPGNSLTLSIFGFLFEFFSNPLAFE